MIETADETAANDHGQEVASLNRQADPNNSTNKINNLTNSINSINITKYSINNLINSTQLDQAQLDQACGFRCRKEPESGEPELGVQGMRKLHNPIRSDGM